MTLDIFLAAIASMAVGAYWYSPKGFGQQWMKLTGLSKKDMKKMELSPGKAMFLGFLTALIMAFVLNFMIMATGVTSLSDYLRLAILIFVGFMMPLTLGPYLWEGKKAKLFYLNGSYWLISTLVQCLVLYYL